MKFYIKDFFSKCDQILSFLGIWLLKKSLMENFSFCAVHQRQWKGFFLNVSVAKQLGRLSNELHESTFEDPYHISCESTNLFEVSHNRYRWNIQKEIDWNHSSAWVFSCKFAAYFQNTFHSSHPPPPRGWRGGGGLSHFSERLYRRDLGQIWILGGNWCFRWEWFF